MLASASPLAEQHPLPQELAFLSPQTLPLLFTFPRDMEPLPAEVNRLNNQVLVHYYEAEWRRWN